MTIHQQFDNCWVIRRPEGLPGDSDITITWNPWLDSPEMKPVVGANGNPLGYFCVQWESVHTHFQSLTGLLPPEESILEGLKYMWAMGGLVSKDLIPVDRTEEGYWT